MVLVRRFGVPDECVYEAAKRGHIFQSMSRKGNRLDNSVMENFFGLLKQEIYHGGLP